MVEIFKSAVTLVSAIAIPMFILVFLGWGLIKKVKVYEVFVEGAKDGFNTAVKIIPFLVAMLFAIGVFRASGAMDVVVAILSPVTNLIGMPAEVLPLGLLRPLSGSGSMGLMTELMKTNGPDSFIGVLASTMFGSSETTFYILAVYFGSVGIKNTRHALPAGLIADLFGMLGAVFITRVLFSL
jgi:spore maturation protein B